MILTAVRTATRIPDSLDLTDGLVSIHFDTDTTETWRINIAGMRVPRTAVFEHQDRFIEWVRQQSAYWTFVEADPDLDMDIGL